MIKFVDIRKPWQEKWSIAERTNHYRADGSEKERQDLRDLGLLRFEALSVYRDINGPQVAVIPLDESSRERAEMIAACPKLVNALVDCLERSDYESDAEWCECAVFLREASCQHTRAHSALWDAGWRK